MALLAPPVDRVLGPLPGNEGEVVYDSWLMARLVLLPKKGAYSASLRGKSESEDRKSVV